MKGLYIQTLGCQMNASDSTRMEAILAPLGYETVIKPADADLVLLNTCSIRDKAEQKMSANIHKLKMLKKSRKGMILGVTGCVAQQEKDAIKRDMPFIDIVLGPDNIDELPWAIEEVQRKKDRFIKAEFHKEQRLWNTETKILNPGPTAMMSVMKGCDHFCSYCIVPHVRGREKSRPIAELVRDVNTLVEQGVREITFLGQNINTFGKRAGESLHELFQRVHEIEGLKRIRFTTSHPGDLKDELIRCFEDLPKLSSNFHLPVQSGSNRILRQMRRFYTVEQFQERVGALRQVRPDIALSSDFIVGFPGETEEEFMESFNLAKETRFDNVYSYVFSSRPGTPAAERPDLTSAEEKLGRLNRLQVLNRTISKELHEAEVGNTLELILEGPSRKDATRMTGRTGQNVPFHLNPEDSQTVKAGDVIKVKVETGSLTHLTGSLIEIVSKSGVDYGSKHKLPPAEARSMDTAQSPEDTQLSF